VQLNLGSLWQHRQPLHSGLHISAAGWKAGSYASWFILGASPSRTIWYQDVCTYAKYQTGLNNGAGPWWAHLLIADHTLLNAADALPQAETTQAEQQEPGETVEDAAEEVADVAKSVADDVAETVQSGIEGAGEVIARSTCRTCTHACHMS
jgi:hypothetical protein